MTSLVPTSGAPYSLTGYSPPPWAPPDGAVSTGDLWRILWRRRMLIVSTTLVIFAAALAYYILSPSRYSAQSEIIVDPRDRQVLVNAVNPSGLAPMVVLPRSRVRCR